MENHSAGSIERTDCSSEKHVSVALQPWVFHALLEHLYTDGTPTALPSASASVEMWARVPPQAILGLESKLDGGSSSRSAAAEIDAACGVTVSEIDDRLTQGETLMAVVEAEGQLQEVVEVTAMVLDAASMFLDIGLRQLCIATLVRSIAACTATRLIELGMLFSSARLLDAATDFVVEGLLQVALPTRGAVLAADAVRKAKAQAKADGLEVTSMQQLPVDFTALADNGSVMRREFSAWLDSPANHEVALHLTRELIERYTTLHFEEVLGAAAGARRSVFGVTHAADLLGEDGVKETWGTQDAAGAFKEQGRGEVIRPVYNGTQSELISSAAGGGIAVVNGAPVVSVHKPPPTS